MKAPPPPAVGAPSARASTAGRRTGLLRAAVVVLGVHAALIAVSIAAFFLVVGKAPPGWLQGDLYGPAYALGMAWTGPLYIVTGFVAALLDWAAAAGWRKALSSAAAIVAIGLAAELLGTSTGWPFGAYGYGELLGWRVLGLVPWVIPLSWFTMLYASYALALRVRTGAVGLVVLSALGLVAWDVLMDPAMSVAFPFWSWEVEGVYFGMPLMNWFGWLVTGLAMGATFRTMVGPDDGTLEARRIPWALYVLNGIFPFALALAEGMLLAGAIGAAAMLLFLAAPRLARALP